VNISFEALHYQFSQKPLVVGGKAMEYYQLRTAGADIDCIVAAYDYLQLAAHYPEDIKERFENFGVCVGKFQFWKSLVWYDYEFLSYEAVEMTTYKVASLERLLFLKALAIAHPKHEQDLRLIVARMHDLQYRRYKKQQE
jgi:hypothetical protein